MGGWAGVAGVLSGWADEWRAVLVFVWCGCVGRGILFNRESNFSSNAIETRVTARSRKQRKSDSSNHLRIFEGVAIFFVIVL